MHIDVDEGDRVVFCNGGDFDIEPGGGIEVHWCGMRRSALRGRVVVGGKVDDPRHRSFYEYHRLR